MNGYEKIVTKPGSRNRVEVIKFSDTEYGVSLVNGEGFGKCWICGRSFKTLAAAERWASKKLA